MSFGEKVDKLMGRSGSTKKSEDKPDATTTGNLEGQSTTDNKTCDACAHDSTGPQTKSSSNQPAQGSIDTFETADQKGYKPHGESTDKQAVEEFLEGGDTSLADEGEAKGRRGSGDNATRKPRRGVKDQAEATAGKTERELGLNPSESGY